MLHGLFSIESTLHIVKSDLCQLDDQISDYHRFTGLSQDQKSFQLYPRLMSLKVRKILVAKARLTGLTQSQSGLRIKL